VEDGDIITHRGSDGVVRYFRLSAIETRSCLRCRTVFPVLHGGQEYCSPRCSDSARKRRWRLRKAVADN